MPGRRDQDRPGMNPGEKACPGQDATAMYPDAERGEGPASIALWPRSVWMPTLGSKDRFTASAQVMPANPTISRTYPMPHAHDGT